MPTAPALDISGIEKRFGEQRALAGVGFQVPQSGIFGLLGPNGAGKTTLLRMLNGITAPDAGSISFFGEPLTRAHLPLIGYLPEERGLYKSMRVGEQALYFAQLRGLDKKEARERLRYWFDRLEVDGWWNKEVSEVSKGMAQKIQFILSVLHEAPSPRLKHPPAIQKQRRTEPSPSRHSLIRIIHRTELQKVTEKYHLDPTTGTRIASNSLQMVAESIEKLAAEHRDFVDEQGVAFAHPLLRQIASKSKPIDGLR